MSRKTLEVLAALAIAVSALALTLHRGASAPPPKSQTIESRAGSPITAEPAALRPRVDVVFALDTTGSMGGLLTGAKRKIWSIANQLASAQPTPEIRMGLVAYRDVGDAYVVQSTPLTADLDTVHAELSRLQAAGGGDGPEHVNKALQTAIDEIAWQRDPQTLRLVFLVGDAPPHDDYADGLNSIELAERAHNSGIIINTIRCGNNPDTLASWQAIAQRAGGAVATIAQNGGVSVVATPFDEELARLDAELNDTMMGYGSAGAKAESRAKVRKRKALSADAAAAAASFSAKSGKVQAEDLLGYLEAGNRLEELSEAELPESLQGKSMRARKDHVATVRRQRAGVRQAIMNASKKRDRYLEQRAKVPGSGAGFDGEVMDMLQTQSAAIGLEFE